MFFTLEIKKREKTLKGKMHDFLYPPQIDVRPLRLGKGLPYYAVSVYLYKGTIPWKSIEEVCGKLCSKAVVDSGIVIDESTKIRRFKPKKLPVTALFLGAVEKLKELSLNRTKTNIVVFDRNGILCGEIFRLVPYVSEIKIVTDKKSCYDDLHDRLLTEYGISIMICGKADIDIISSAVIISDRSSDIPSAFNGILFTNEKRKLLGATVFCSDKINLPPDILGSVPKGIPPLYFASALYELCAVKELQNVRVQF